jgi:type I restriction enzyme R subunit
VINQRFGTDFNEADQLFFDQIVQAALRVEHLERAASANSLEKFQLLFGQILESLFIERMDLNEEMFARFMNDHDFQQIVSRGLGKRVYDVILKEATAKKTQGVVVQAEKTLVAVRP